MRFLRVWIILLIAATSTTPTTRADDALPSGAKLRLGTTNQRTVRPASVALSPDGKWVAYRPTPDTIRITEALSGKEVRVLTIKEKEIGIEMTFSGDGRRLVFFSNFGVTFLDPLTGEKTGGFSGTTEREYVRYAISGDGSLGATTLQEKNSPVKLWDGKTGAAKGEIKPAQNGPLFLALSESGKVLVTTGRHFLKDGATEHLENVVEVWDASTQKRIKQIDVGGPPLRLQLSADGKWLAMYFHEGPGRVEVWEIATGKKTATITPRYVANYPALYFSPDAKQLAVAPEHGRISVWNIADAKSSIVSEVDCRRVAGVSFATEGVVAAGLFGPTLFGSSAQTVLAWKLAGEAPRVPSGHLGNVWLLRFTADGKDLITVGSDDRVVRWDATTGKELGVLVDRYSEGHPPMYALSADAKLFVTKGRGKVRLLDLEAGKELASLDLGPRVEFTVWENAIFSADGKSLIGLGWYEEKQPPGKAGRSFAAIVCSWDIEKKRLQGMRRDLVDSSIYAPGACRDLLKKHYADQLPDPTKDESRPIVTTTANTFDPWTSKLDFGSGIIGMRLLVKAPKTGAKLLEIDTGCCYPEAVAVSPGGKRLAVGWNDSTVIVYDLPEPKK